MGFREHVIVAGNPDSGKSSILKCVLGCAVFGTCDAGGCRQAGALVSFKVGDVLYSETPGLRDVSERERAAKEISKALRRGGRIKLIFVITLEGGRIRADDLMMMKIILSAIHRVNVDPTAMFSVIVNKCETELMEEGKDRQKERDYNFAVEGVVPRAFEYMPYGNSKAKDVFDSRDKSKLENFIATAPVFDLPKRNSVSVRSERFDEKLERLSSRMRHVEGKVANLPPEERKKPNEGLGELLKKLGTKVCRHVDRVMNTPIDLHG